jgi:hypothetical protein
MVWSRGCIAYLALKVLEDAMKFATTRLGARLADAEHLLQVTLRNFRRIYAAKRSFRGREAIPFRKISKLFQWLERRPRRTAPIVACCTYAAAKRAA